MAPAISETKGQRSRADDSAEGLDHEGAQRQTLFPYCQRSTTLNYAPGGALGEDVVRVAWMR